MSKKPRMSWQVCAEAVRQAAGRALTDEEVAQIFERAQLRQRAIQASGALDNLDGRLRAALENDAGELAIQAELARKHAALSIIARDRATRHIERLLEQPGMNPRLIGNVYRNAVLALFEGTTRGVEGGRVSIAATKLAYEARFVGDAMLARIVREVPHAERMLRDRAFLDDVVREMMETREGGTPGRTGNRDAQIVARIFADAAEQSRNELNRLGANIGRLAGWAGPQIHDADRIAAAGREAWIDAILPRLDLGRTFPDVVDMSDVRRILGNVWENIVFSPDRAAPRADATGTGFKGPFNIARALEQHRVLHFATADDWLSYSREFGRGHIFDGMVAHQQRAALLAAQMEVLGPNPGATLDAVLEALRRRVDTDERIPPEKKAAVKASLSRDAGTAVGKAFRVASGHTMIPRSQEWADIGGMIRGIEALSKLGGAVISAITDLPIAITNLRFNGLTFGEAVGGQVRELLRGRGRGEARELAYLIGEGFDGAIGHLTSPFVANDGAPGAMQRALSAFFRLTGLTAWTDMNRAAAARVLSAYLGRQADRDFASLPARTQNVFRQHGITPEMWDVMRTEGRRVIGNRTYIVPGFGNSDVDMALRRYLADEVQSSVLEADAATQRYVTQGTQRGTIEGEAIRFVMQFKAFPAAFTSRALGRAFGGGPDGGRADIAHIGTLIAGVTILGYAAMTAKDFLRGYEPKEFTDEEGNPRLATILAALVQGGGAGIYGDFLFGAVSRSGNTALENVAGPAASDAARWVNLLARARDGDATAAEALDAALSSTPFANVWFARPVLDYLILNALREALSPGQLARQDERRRQQFGQDPLLAPSDRMAFELR